MTTTWHEKQRDPYPPGYRHDVATVHALCDVLLHYMDDEEWGPAGGYVLRDDPRNLAQAVLDQLGAGA